MTLSRKTRAEMREIASYFKVKISFRKQSISWANGFSSEILIGENCLTTKEDQWSVFFHEIGHIVAFRNKKFWDYHSADENSSAKKIRNAIRTTIFAEMYVDELGKKIMKFYKPELEFSYSIKGSPEVIQWYVRNEIRPWQKRLALRKK